MENILQLEHVNECSVFVHQVEIMRPKPGYCEMDPDLLWRQVQQVIKDCIKGDRYRLCFCARLEICVCLAIITVKCKLV